MRSESIILATIRFAHFSQLFTDLLESSSAQVSGFSGSAVQCPMEMEDEPERAEWPKQSRKVVEADHQNRPRLMQIDPCRWESFGSLPGGGSQVAQLGPCTSCSTLQLPPAPKHPKVVLWLHQSAPTCPPSSLSSWPHPVQSRPRPGAAKCNGSSGHDIPA